MQKKSMVKMLAVYLGAAVMAVALSAGAYARDLTVALRAEPTSMDLHYHALTSNIQINQTLFDPLVCRDDSMVLQPCLAESWSVDGNVWTFKLRPGVLFSDGTPFTAQDVVFSLKRVPVVPNAPSPFTVFMQHITNVEAVDDLTVQITTDRPYPLVPNNMSGVAIMSAHAAGGAGPEGMSTTQLNAGEGLVGTGPYRFVSWRRGADLVFERNPHYWGDAPEWDRVIYRPITNPASRIAALLAGDVDFVEDPPVDDLARLQNNPNVRVVVRGPSYRVVFIGLDTYRQENTPDVSGTPDARNPLLDRRVREAMSLAIDRQAIVNRIMNGIATPAAQPLAYPMFGTREDLVNVPPADAERAKALLAEAGYPNGFNVVLHTPNGRYMNDVRVSQTIATMWSRIGIRTTVDAGALSVYFSAVNKYEYSVFLLGWGASTGEVSNSLSALMMTVDKDKGQGTSNAGRYSNPALDQIILEADAELDDAKRSALLQEGVKIGMEDYAILPLHFEHTTWAMKPEINYSGRIDQMTMAADITSAQ